MSTSSAPPLLTVIIDTEEEFDWAGPFSRQQRAVTSISAQPLAHEIFRRHKIVPTYVIDHPVASDADAVAVLKPLADAGECLIGAHLHPWVNPPYEEWVSRRNSYPGNLPPALERAKLEVLTETIEATFGVRPTIYKAGRYGLGPNTPRILQDLGYRVDASVVPFTDFSADEGPDFAHEDPLPRLLAGTDSVMELPLSVGFVGHLRRRGAKLFPPIAARERFRVPGVFARSGLLERIRLSPEGSDASDHIRLVRAMIADGHRVFSYTYHSPSLAPGHTPYVRDAVQRDAFLAEMETFFSTFFGAMNGRSATPLDIYERWRRERPDAERLSA